MQSHHLYTSKEILPMIFRISRNFKLCFYKMTDTFSSLFFPFSIMISLQIQKRGCTLMCTRARMNKCSTLQPHPHYTLTPSDGDLKLAPVVCTDLCICAGLSCSVCARVCEMCACVCQMWKVCIICLRGTNKQRITDLCSVCSLSRPCCPGLQGC